LSGFIHKKCVKRHVMVHGVPRDTKWHLSVSIEYSLGNVPLSLQQVTYYDTTCLCIF